MGYYESCGLPAIVGSTSARMSDAVNEVYMRSDHNVHMRDSASPLYVRILSRLVRPFPDFDFGFIKPLRSRAVALLQLNPGARVLDVGCGSGGSFPSLVEAVGPAGSVVGIELSPNSASHARRRVTKNGWHNVEIVVAAAESVALAGSYDGLLMFAAPDVYASMASLERLIPSLGEGARIVFFGGKRSTRRFGWLFNGLLHLALTKLSLPTTPGLELEPWRHVASRVRDLQIEEYFYGWMFLASGTLVGNERDPRTLAHDSIAARSLTHSASLTRTTKTDPRSMMKRDASILAMIVLGLVTGCGTIRANAAGPSDAVEAEIQRLEQVEVQAVLAHDTATLKRLWGKQYVVNNPDNQIVLANADPLDRPVLKKSRIAFTREVEHITVLRDVAISMGSETVISGGDSLEPEKTVKRRYTNIWMRVDGAWKLVARHANNICEHA